MSTNTSDNSTISLDEQRKRVAEQLHNLVTQHSIRSLRELFTSELNYEYANSSLPLPNERSQRLVHDSSLLIATGGEDNRFEIIYIHLAGTLSLNHERTLITKLLPDHPFVLFVFSNKDQDRWHFVNVRESNNRKQRPLLRRITIGPEERLRTAIERISMLDLASLAPELWGNISPLPILNAHDTAFDVEAVTRTFYREYRTMFDILQKDLFKQTGDRTWAHDYALQFLNRCMFLYFIQRKRWLGDDTEFFKLFWNSYNNVEHEQDTFASRWLNTLFFRAFNDKYSPAFNIFPPHIHDILMMAPYLNGGLFSENELDRKDGFLISDARFQQVFSLLERYSFTIAEDSPLDQEVAVDPEMIGTVYESLVNVSEDIDERGDAGIFYTPRTEIDLMCRLTVVDYLTNYIGEQHKKLLYDVVFAIEQEDKEQADQQLMDAKLWNQVYDDLHNVKVVDPACGSGAFLVGMLAVLDDLMSRAVTRLGLEHTYSPYNAYERKKRIIGQSLYGVDVMEWATHIAELRLWLALIVDTEYEREELHARREPLLPYFTFKVRCGDSLVQEIEGINLGIKQRHHLSPMLRRRVETLKQQKQDFYENKPSRELHTKDDVAREERRLFDDLLLDRIHEIEEKKKIQVRRIEEVSAQPVQLEGMGNNAPLPSLELRERQRQLAELEDELVRLRHTRATFAA